MANGSDLYMRQGSDYRGTLHIYNADGTDADLTGYTGKAQIRRDVADKCPEVAADIELTFASPLVHLFVPRTVTQEMCGRYVWDLDLTDATGEVTTPAGAEGNVIVTQEVTREAVMAVRA